MFDAGIIVIFCSVAGSSAVPYHWRFAEPAKKFSGHKIHVRIFGLSFEIFPVAFQHFLNLPEQFFRNNAWNSIFNANRTIFINANIAVVPEDSGYGGFLERLSGCSSLSFSIESICDCLHLKTSVVCFKDINDDFCAFLIYGILSIYPLFITQRKISMVDHAFSCVCFHSSANLPGKLRGIIFRHSLKDGFEDDSFGRFGDILFRRENPDAVLFKRGFIRCGIVTVPAESVEGIDDDVLEPLFRRILNHSLELRAAVGLSGYGAVGILADYLDVLAFGKFTAFLNLLFNGSFPLAVRGKTGIYDSMELFVFIVQT